MRSNICKWAIRVFAVLYLLALIALAISVFGLFGQERDPVAAVYLVPLGFPWIIWADLAPETMLPWVAALAPALNLIILVALCGALSGRRGEK